MPELPACDRGVLAADEIGAREEVTPLPSPMKLNPPKEVAPAEGYPMGTSEDQRELNPPKEDAPPPSPKKLDPPKVLNPAPDHGNLLGTQKEVTPIIEVDCTAEVD